MCIRCTSAVRTAQTGVHVTDFSTRYHTTTVDGLDVFYREAGDRANPSLLLLHGFPSSSHMFRNLITSLSDKYHLVAPDHIGFGRSAMPSVDEFTYSFDRLTEITEGLIGSSASIASLSTSTTTAHPSDCGSPPRTRTASTRSSLRAAMPT